LVRTTQVTSYSAGWWQWGQFRVAGFFWVLSSKKSRSSMKHDYCMFGTVQAMATWMSGYGENGAQEKGKTVSRSAGRQRIGTRALGGAPGREGGAAQEQEGGEAQTYAGKAAGRGGVALASLVEGRSHSETAFQNDSADVAIGPAG